VLDSAEAVVRSQLADGEQLVWSGRPRQGLALQPFDVALIPFSLLFGGFTFYWEYEVVSTHQFWVLQFWGIPFVLLGSYMVLGRFLVDAYVRGHTYYGVTDKRVIIAQGSNTQGIALSDLTGVAVNSYRDRSGTIVFGIPGLPPPSSYNAVFQSTRVTYPMFTMIPDVQSVYDQIEAGRKA
jgi:hypothetical protein